jgi:hypothetical protein
MAAHHLSLTLCEHCGGALPQRRQVVTIAERVALQGKGDRSRVIPLRPPASPDVR